MKQMHFDDFEMNDIRSKKRKIEKQPDFLPSSRKFKQEVNFQFFTCLSISDRTADKSLITANERIVDAYLKLLSDSFSYDLLTVIAIKCTDSNENAEDSHEGHKIIFDPNHTEFGWELRIQIDETRKNHQFFGEIHQQIYLMLMKATAVLTKQDYSHGLWNKFHSFMNNVLNFQFLYSNCYGCFAIANNKSFACEICSLIYCSSCKCLRH